MTPTRKARHEAAGHVNICRLKSDEYRRSLIIITIANMRRRHRSVKRTREMPIPVNGSLI